MTELSIDMPLMGTRAKAAASLLSLSDAETRNKALVEAVHLIEARTDDILDANAIDLKKATEKAPSSAMLDRLALNQTRLNAIAHSLRQIAAMPEVVGEIITTLKPANGLTIERVRVPIGVIGIIYESRPNVTADAGALCLKAGNAVILRGGSESYHSSVALHGCLVEGLRAKGLPTHAIQYVTTTDRAAVGQMLEGLNGTIDLIIPRGGKSLVARVEEEARVPVLSHLDGICHTYIDEGADLEMARDITLNAKMRRTGVCGATETLLIHRSVLQTHLPPIVKALREAGCTLRGDRDICAQLPEIAEAVEDDWSTEYLDAVLSIACVDHLDDALAHIAMHSSHHTECIITEDLNAAEKFLNAVDSAIVMHNASTQFADGGEVGLGAEIGIATGRLHARGPVGAEGLTTYKYRVRGNGQSRP